jgi:hypothetical protein
MDMEGVLPPEGANPINFEQNDDYMQNNILNRELVRFDQEQESSGSYYDSEEEKELERRRELKKMILDPKLDDGTKIDRQYNNDELIEDADLTLFNLIKQNFKDNWKSFKKTDCFLAMYAKYFAQKKVYKKT